MASLLNGLTYNVVARYGLAADVPALIEGELGYDTDKKVFRVGDDTPSPSRVMTEKSVGEFNYGSLSSVTVCGLTFANGTVNGIDLSGLNQGNGLLCRKGSGKFGTAVLRCGDQTLNIVGGNGNAANIDVRVNMPVLQASLGVANLPFVKKAGDIMTGSLSLPEVNVVGNAGTLRQSTALTGSLKRWGWGGDGEPENGSNSGTDWAVSRYADSGTFIDTPFWIDRASGYAYVKHGIVMPDGRVLTRGTVLPPNAKGYLHNDGLGNLAWIDVELSASSLTVSPATIVQGIQGIAYSQTFTASGGVAPYTFSHTGSLPTGLTLSSSGVLSGTPSASGTFNFTIAAADSSAPTAMTGSRAYTLVVAASTAPALTITPASLTNATRGVSYTATLVPGGGTAPYAFVKSSGTLPAGLALSSAGVITGTPTESGAFNFTVTLTDSAGTPAVKSQAYQLIVEASQFLFVVNYSVDNLNLFAFANSPTAVGDYIFIINPGVYVRSPDASLPAMRTGVFPEGSTLNVINNGDIQGAGGNGGYAVAVSAGAGVAGSVPSNLALQYRMSGSTIILYHDLWAGRDGGNAVQLDMATTLDNTNGRIFGGGGGGMGAVGTQQQLGGAMVSGAAGGGGGGQGAYTTSPGAGLAGGATGQYGGPSNPGIGGMGQTFVQTVGGPYESGGGIYTIVGASGTSGASWGNNASSISFPPLELGVAYDTAMRGGLGGKAVSKTGKTLTWIGGNNTNQVKGAVA